MNFTEEKVFKVWQAVLTFIHFHINNSIFTS